VRSTSFIQFAWISHWRWLAVRQLSDAKPCPFLAICGAPSGCAAFVVAVATENVISFELVNGTQSGHVLFDWRQKVPIPRRYWYRRLASPRPTSAAHIEWSLFGSRSTLQRAMSQTTLNKIWTVVAVATLYSSLNAWSISQQWQLSLPGNPFLDGKFTPHGVRLVAIPLAGSLLIVTALLTRLYSVRFRGKNWPARIPMFSNLTVDVTSTEGRLAQAASTTMFLLLPAAAQIHFVLKFFEGTFYRENEPLWSGLQHLTRYVPISDAFSGKYFYDRLGAIAPGFAPFWEPWSLVLLEVAVFSFLTWSLTTVFRCGEPPRRPLPPRAHRGYPV
jgi:hypothetical protein